MRDKLYDELDAVLGDRPATIAQRLQLDLASPEPIKPHISFTGGPDSTVTMHVAQRREQRRKGA